MPNKCSAFTLIELLVVITIIVVLLALLTPALDKAIYQTELAVCGTNQRAAAMGLQSYATDQKRMYPTRSGISNMPTNQIYAHVGAGGTNTWTVDDRPILEGYVVFNKMFNDPLTDRIDLEANHKTTTDQIYMAYSFWPGYAYLEEKGMRKLGDKLEYNGSRFDVIVSDYIMSNRNEGYGSGAHPDKDGAWQLATFQEEPTPWVANGASGDAYSTTTFSEWGGGPRGEIDANFAHGDGSVQRIDNLEWLEPGAEDQSGRRLRWLARYGDKASLPNHELQLPAID